MAILLAARPKTLPAAVVPVWLGCVLAWWLTGSVHWPLSLWTVLGSVWIQIGTNFFNDAIDHAKGADTAARLGPRRASASGLLSRRAVYLLAAGCLVLAVLCGIPLFHARGWPMLAIGLPSLYFAFGYTGGPLPLAYRGLGEVFVILFFGLVAVAGTVFVQTGTWPAAAGLLGMQVGLLSAVLIGVNNLRDIDEDRQSAKRTLAVRCGKRAARVMITVFCLLPQVLGVGWLVVGGAHGLALALGGLPALALGAGVLRVWRTEPGPAYNRFLALGALQLVVFAIGFTLAAVLAR
jgi:1,4-dihydroxy-2-naphthoate octaprenyltransferase